MKIFIDTASVKDIKEAASLGLIDGGDIFSWKNGFIDLRDDHGEFVAGVCEELFTPRGGGGKNQGLGINIQCPISNVQ